MCRPKARSGKDAQLLDAYRKPRPSDTLSRDRTLIFRSASSRSGTIRQNTPAPYRAPVQASSASVCAIPCRQTRRARSEEHTSELQSLMRISYAVFCLKKKKNSILLIKCDRTKID